MFAGSTVPIGYRSSSILDARASMMMHSALMKFVVFVMKVVEPAESKTKHHGSVGVWRPIAVRRRQ